MSTNIFFTGASGYIGGTVLTKLIQAGLPCSVSALVRSDAQATKLKELGVRPVKGSLSDIEVIKKESSEADVVYNCANCDDEPSIKAIIAGLTAKFDITGKKGLLIHTSGTGELVDNANGEPGKIIYDDLEGLQEVHELPLSQPHRPVDDYIINHTDHSKVDTVVICPPCIYGTGSGPFNKTSIQVPAIIRSTLELGSPHVLGRGMNYWSNVHISDLGDLYILVLEKGLKGEISTGEDGWFFAENGEDQWKNLTVAIAEKLKKRGLISKTEISPFDDSAIEKYLGGAEFLPIWLGNSRSRAKRARKLGWQPKMGSIDDYLDETIDVVLKAQPA